MTVNITINADTLEMYSDGELAALKVGRTTGLTDMYVEKSTRDTLADLQAKTKVAEDVLCAKMDEMTKGFEDRKVESDSECDRVVRRKLKPQRMSEIKQIEDGLYFRRETPELPWSPWVKARGTWTVSATDELLGPITPDMFL